MKTTFAWLSFQIHSAMVSGEVFMAFDPAKVGGHLDYFTVKLVTN